ncbi:protein phosphatase 1 regulatory subunit 17 [Pholidichthys leucotaenia]
MTSGCVRKTEHGVMPQKTKSLCLSDQETIELEQKSEEQMNEGEQMASCADVQLKKPRRKDTPVLSCPPHIPGVRLLKPQKPGLHLEEEEEEAKH